MTIVKMTIIISSVVITTTKNFMYRVVKRTTKDGKTMKLHITVTDDKKRTRKAKAPKKSRMPKTKTAKAKTPAKPKKNINWKEYWAKRKAQEKKQGNPPAGGNNEESK